MSADDDPWGHAFITRLDPGDGDGPTLAVKDCIDVAGETTTAGSLVVAAQATPASADAVCLTGARAAGARIVGKTNLHELCFGATGVNGHYGTPVNPLDPRRIPGGSSSGSAVAVARGFAEVAYGTDTAGSVRNPAACCGVTGLKTTWGRIPVDGTRPLAPSMDTIGPLARGVAGVTLGMRLLEPGFTTVPCDLTAAKPIGRLRGLEVDPRVDAAVDAALARLGHPVVDVTLDHWARADRDGRTLMYAEALAVNAALLADDPVPLGADLLDRFAIAARITPDELAEVRSFQQTWRTELAEALADVLVLALPGYPGFPAVIGAHDPASNTTAVAVSFAGNPGLVLPVPTVDGPPTTVGTPFPASLQLVGAWNTEADLCALGAHIEDTLAITAG